MRTETTDKDSISSVTKIDKVRYEFMTGSCVLKELACRALQKALILLQIFIAIKLISILFLSLNFNDLSVYLFFNLILFPCFLHFLFFNIYITAGTVYNDEELKALRWVHLRIFKIHLWIFKRNAEWYRIWIYNSQFLPLIPSLIFWGFLLLNLNSIFQ